MEEQSAVVRWIVKGTFCGSLLNSDQNFWSTCDLKFAFRNRSLLLFLKSRCCFKYLLVVMYYTPGHFFKKVPLVCIVHNYSRLMETILWKFWYGSIWGTRAFFHILIPLHGVSKHLRQRKLARSKRSFSEVLTTCKMSRGWKMRCELRNSGLVGRVALATMA